MTIAFDLRPAGGADGPFLRALYGDSRADEMALTGWPPEQVAAFLDRQFDLQAAGYRARFGEGGHVIVRVKGRPVGRAWTHDGDRVRRLVDISIAAEHRSKGLGGAVVRRLQAGARRRGLGMELSVLEANRAAIRLYERLGFRPGLGVDAGRLAMTWRASGTVS